MELRWSRASHVRAWIAGCRLDAYAKQVAVLPRDDAELAANVERVRTHIGPALANLERLRRT